MPIRARLLIALIAGAGMVLLNLLAEWLLNRELVRTDFLISVLAGVFVMLIVFLLLRHLPDRYRKNN